MAAPIHVTAGAKAAGDVGTTNQHITAIVRPRYSNRPG